MTRPVWRSIKVESHGDVNSRVCHVVRRRQTVAVGGGWPEERPPMTIPVANGDRAAGTSDSTQMGRHTMEMFSEATRRSLRRVSLPYAA